MKKTFLLACICLGFTQLWAQQGVVFKLKYLPNHSYQTNVSMEMKATVTVTGDSLIINKLKEQGITQPVNANVSLVLAGVMKTGALGADQSVPITMDYKITNLSVSANGNQVPIPPKATEKDIRMFGHVTQDWKIKIDSADGKAVADSAQKKMEQMMNMMQKQIQFPDKPLKPGDSFTQGGPMNIPVGKEGNSVRVDMGITYKLIRIADGKAYFDMIPNFNMNLQIGKVSAVMSGTGTGSMIYSIKDSFPISKVGTVNMKIKVTSPKINVDGTAVATSKYDCVIN